MTEGTGALVDVDVQPDGLAGRLVRGDAQAFDDLVSLHQARITRLAYRLLGWRGEVEDVVQEVFLSALRHASRFRQEASLATWLTTITINTCRSHQRRRYLAKMIFGHRKAHERDKPAPRPPVEHGLAAVETSARVRSAVQALAPRDREVVVLRYFENLAPAEIGTMTGQSRNAVEVRLHRARAKLAEALRDLSEEDQKP